MNEIKIGDKTICVAEVPEKAISIYIDHDELIYYVSQNGDPLSISIGDDYSILGRASEITEEQAKGIVEESDDELASIEITYVDYSSDDRVLYKALESWKSFMRANNIKDTDLILLKLS